LNEPAETKDGRYIATSSDSGVYLFDQTTKQWSRLTDVASNPHWSPDGRFLAFSRRDQSGFRVWVLPFDPKAGKASGPERRVTVRNGRFFTWSPDGKEIAFISPDSGFTTIWIQPFNGGDERKAARVRGFSTGVPAWSPDGKAIYFGAGEGAGQVARVTLSTGKVDSLRPMRDLLGISSDGRYIAQGNYRFASVVISSAVDGHEVTRLNLPPNMRGFAWSSRVPGEMVGLDHPIHQEIHSISLADGSVRRLVTGDSTRFGGARLSPDGSQLVFTSGTRLVVSRADGTGARTLKTAAEVTPLSASWSPDGARVLYLSVDPKELHVVDARSGADTKLATLHEAFPFALRIVQFVWRRDGKAVRYSKLDADAKGPSYNLHEVSLTGRDTVLATLKDSIRAGYYDFVNDTLFLGLTNNGIAGYNLNAHRWTALTDQGPGGFAISRDGSKMAFEFWTNPRTDDAAIHLVEGSSTRTINNPLGGEVQQMYFMPDGKSIVAAVCATCGQGAERRQLVLFPLNGDPPRVLSGKAGTIMDWDFLSIAPDGRTLVYDPELAWRSAVVHIPVDIEPRP